MFRKTIFFLLFLLGIMLLFSVSASAILCYDGLVDVSGVCTLINPATCADNSAVSYCGMADSNYQDSPPLTMTCAYSILRPDGSVCRSIAAGTCGNSVPVSPSTMCCNYTGAYSLQTDIYSNSIFHTRVKSTAFTVGAEQCCGNGVCDNHENCASCPSDCPTPAGYCCYEGALIAPNHSVWGTLCYQSKTFTCTGTASSAYEVSMCRALSYLGVNTSFYCDYNGLTSLS